jgi:hypothetical protein
MEPQVKKIFSKLPKTELATDKVELSLVDDAKAVIKDTNRRISEIEKNGKAWEVLDRKIKDNGDYIVDFSYDALDSIKTKLERASKELGVTIPEISKIEKTLNDIRTIRKRYTF